MRRALLGEVLACFGHIREPRKSTQLCERRQGTASTERGPGMLSGSAGSPM